MDEEWRSYVFSQEYVFFSSDEYIKCLCADQSGKRSMKLVKRSKDVGDDDHSCVDEGKKK